MTPTKRAATETQALVAQAADLLRAALGTREAAEVLGSARVRRTADRAIEAVVRLMRELGRCR